MLWDTETPAEATYLCSRCDARLQTGLVAVEHFYFLHGVPRDLAWIAIQKSRPPKGDA